MVLERCAPSGQDTTVCYSGIEGGRVRRARRLVLRRRPEKGTVVILKVEAAVSDVVEAPLEMKG